MICAPNNRFEQAISIDDSAGSIKIGFVNGRITISRKYRCARQSTEVTSNSGQLFHALIAGIMTHVVRAKVPK
jgi:hypothetical protein